MEEEWVVPCAVWGKWEWETDLEGADAVPGDDWPRRAILIFKDEGAHLLGALGHGGLERQPPLVFITLPAETNGLATGDDGASLAQEVARLEVAL